MANSSFKHRLSDREIQEMGFSPQQVDKYYRQMMSASLDTTVPSLETSADCASQSGKSMIDELASLKAELDQMYGRYKTKRKQERQIPYLPPSTSVSYSTVLPSHFTVDMERALTDILGHLDTSKTPEAPKPLNGPIPTRRQREML
jgi:hypothetical protein